MVNCLWSMILIPVFVFLCGSFASRLVWQLLLLLLLLLLPPVTWFNDRFYVSGYLVNVVFLSRKCYYHQPSGRAVVTAAVTPSPPPGLCLHLQGAALLSARRFTCED